MSSVCVILGYNYKVFAEGFDRLRMVVYTATCFSIHEEGATGAN